MPNQLDELPPRERQVAKRILALCDERDREHWLYVHCFDDVRAKFAEACWPWKPTDVDADLTCLAAARELQTSRDFWRFV